MSRSLARKPKPQKVTYLVCPTCSKEHPEHKEFGCFCCASCLQTVIRPLIVTLTNGQLRGRA
jgi:protein-arginine kinase activator protein McsA